MRYLTNVTKYWIIFEKIYFYFMGNCVKYEKVYFHRTYNFLKKIFKIIPKSI